MTGAVAADDGRRSRGAELAAGDELRPTAGLMVDGIPRYRSAGSAMFLKIGAATVPP
jgi:hypothetical protein